MDRRSFALGLVGVTLGRRPPDAAALQAAALPTRRLGPTDLDVPILGLGGSHLAQAGSERAARALVDVALEEGIRFFDTAESYGDGRSERWLGAALQGMREQVLIMTKTFDFPARTVDGARRHLEGSLERLRIDRLDLWQLHSIRSVTDVDRAFGAGGAMEYILEAKARGVVHSVGVTGHVRPEAHRRALEYWDRGIRFDAMQMPLNPIDYHQQSFERGVLPELVRRGIGVIAMKTSADGRLPRAGICTVAECLRYVWTLPVAVAVVGMERPELVRENARLARAFRPLAPADVTSLRARIASRARLDLEWYKGS